MLKTVVISHFGIISLLAQEAKITDYLDFDLAGSLDFAYTQTPLHYLAYQDSSVHNDFFKPYFTNARKTITSGVGFGLWGGIGSSVYKGSPLSLGMQYQFSYAGSSVRKVSPYQEKVVMASSYMDHRFRIYSKLNLFNDKNCSFSFTLFTGLALIHLGNLLISENDNYTNPVYNGSIALIKDKDNQLFFRSPLLYGWDLGVRLSIYMLTTTFDLAITPEITIPRFSLGFSLNKETLNMING